MFVVSVTTESGSTYKFIESSNGKGCVWTRESDHPIIGSEQEEGGILVALPEITYGSRMQLLRLNDDTRCIWTSRVIGVSRQQF